MFNIKHMMNYIRIIRIFNKSALCVFDLIILRIYAELIIVSLSFSQVNSQIDGENPQRIFAVIKFGFHFAGFIGRAFITVHCTTHQEQIIICVYWSVVC